MPARYLPPSRYRYPYRVRRRGGGAGNAVALAIAAAVTIGSLGHAAPSAAHRPAAPAQALAVAPAPAPASANAALGQRMAAGYGWGRGSQWSCLDALWTRESGWRMVWNYQGSGAYGIPQSLPASKMASAGADYMTNPATQIKWGLGYISQVYGTPCGAWGHETSAGWY